MNTNDILRRLRYAIDLSDTHMLDLFAKGGSDVSRAQFLAFLANEEDPAFQDCSPVYLAQFLDGLILDKRGPRDPSKPAPPPANQNLSNNDVLRKLRIALNLQQDQMLDVLKRGGAEVSPSELSALFRKRTHKHYRACGDQFLRKFLVGLTTVLRPDSVAPVEDA
ncbi:MAG: DUF1456 family protein [Myxococcota bacterium]